MFDFKSHQLAVSIMKSNSVIVRTYTWKNIHSFDMDWDAELATLRNPPNQHCDVLQLA